MTTLADAEQHRETLLSLATLAIRDLVAWWESLDLLDTARVAAELRELMPELFATYGLAAGAVAADFYEDMRAEAVAAAAAYSAVTVDSPGDDVAQALVGWGLAPLFPKEETEADVDLALSRLSGGLQRAVANSGRQTIITNARRDPLAVRYVRHASANACAFCALLATRQAAYLSEESASRVVSDSRRNKQAVGEKYHHNCHCVAVPVWPGSELEEPPYVADWREAYYDARKRVENPNDLKALLAVMRDTAGLR